MPRPRPALHKTSRGIMATPVKASDSEIRVFCSWFTTLTSAEKHWFLDKLVPLATPHKLFAQLERSTLGARVLPTTWNNCRDFEERALFCVARVQSWEAARANSFINLLEAIDQDAVYEFYDKIALAYGEP